MLLATAMGCSACLVATTPEFQEPPPEGPFLIAGTAKPDLREILVIREDDRPQFTVEVASQNPEPLQARLLVDYGTQNKDTCEPYQSVRPQPNVPTTFGGGSATSEGNRLSDGPVTYSFRYVPGDTMDKAGCHRLTLMVARGFKDDVACPVKPNEPVTEETDRDQSAELTWIVQRCTGAECPPPDATPPFDPETDCPPVTDSCFDDQGQFKPPGEFDRGTKQCVRP